MYSLGLWRLDFSCKGEADDEYNYRFDDDLPAAPGESKVEEAPEDSAKTAVGENGEPTEKTQLLRTSQHGLRSSQYDLRSSQHSHVSINVRNGSQTPTRRGRLRKMFENVPERCK